MTFKPGDRAVKIRIPEQPHEVPAGGPYTIAMVDSWNFVDVTDHDFKPDCHAVRVQEWNYRHYRDGLRVYHDWDCSCEYRHLPPPEPAKALDATKRGIPV